MNETQSHQSRRWDPAHAERLAAEVADAGGVVKVADALGRNAHRTLSQYRPQGWASLLALMCDPGHSVTLPEPAVVHVLGTVAALSLPLPDAGRQAVAS